MKARIFYGGLLSLIMSFLGTIPEKSWAYAGFSRNYNLPCEFCHIQWPKLSDQGNFFNDRGFMLSTTGTGNGLDMMFQRSEGQNYFPIGFHMSVAYGGEGVQGVGTPSTKIEVGNGDISKIPPVTLGGGGSSSSGGWGNGAYAPTPWSLLSGGLLSSWISYWVQPSFQASPSGAPSFGIPSLWVRFDTLMGTTLFNLYAGVTSQDTPFSNRRALQRGAETPYVMYDYLPGTPEVANNNAFPFISFGTAALSAYFDADRFQMENDHTALRYFGYLFENGCGSEEAFSIDPCETRLSISLLPNSGLYGTLDGGQTIAATAAAGISQENNGVSLFWHLTQSFGGWGATNGDRVGFFGLLGQGAMSQGGGGGGVSPNVFFTREGTDFSANPIPDGVLNIFGAVEFVSDPAGGIVANPALFGTPHPAVSGLSYLTWFLEGDWQPTFKGFFVDEGTGSNMIIVTYNQLQMLSQPSFSGISQSLPGNFNDVLSFGIADRYWLYSGDRSAISLFAEWQWMFNDGVGSIATTGGTRLEGYATSLNIFSNGGFFNVESTIFLAGVDFSY